MKLSVVSRFEDIRRRSHKVRIYESSITRKNNYLLFLIRENLECKLVIIGPKSMWNHSGNFVSEEEGQFKFEAEVIKYIICPCNHLNAVALRKLLPFTSPKVIGLAPAIGTGDRLGLATPGHIRALRGLNIVPVLAQQSSREMIRTSRSPSEVLDSVSWAVFQEGYKGGFGADADHLKTIGEVDTAFEAGFTMYTIDPSDFVDGKADGSDCEMLKEKFDQLPWKELECEREDYLEILGRNLGIVSPRESKMTGINVEALTRTAVKYSAAIAYTAKIYRHLLKLFGRRKFDVEMSVDETETPTSPLEHILIASELKRLGVRISGLALRFPGRFEKGIDFVGDLGQFEESFMRHVLTAQTCGPYKLSIHSGSDKFSIFPIIGRLASNMIHLKTAGTNYLEALRIVVRHDPALFREIVKYSMTCFEKDRKSYHLSTNLSVIPNPDQVPKESLETVFLDENNGRQLLHVTYGSILAAKDCNGKMPFRDRLRRILIENEEEHYETVAKHIKRHTESVWIFAEKK